MTRSTAVMAIGGLVFAVTALAQEASWRVETTPVGPVPASVRREIPSADGRHMVWMAFTNNQQAVILDGKADPLFPIIKTTPLISPDGTRVTYKVDSPDGARRAMVVDGQAGPIHENMSLMSMQFSPDSRHLYYLVMDGPKSDVARDGVALGLDPPVQGGFWLSPDCMRMAWKTAPSNEPNRRQMIFDGKPCGPVVDQVLNPSVVFSLDGKRLAYLAQNGQGAAYFQAKKSFAVVDGAAQPEFDKVEGLQFSPDGATCVYVATEGATQRVVVNGKPGPEFNAIDPYFLRCSGDGQRIGYRAEKAEKQALVIDGKEGEPFDGILDWCLSPDGKRVAVVARQGAGYVAVADGKAGTAADFIAPPVVFSQDGAHFAYRAMAAGKWRVVLDGQAGEAWDLIPDGPWFSPDGKRLAFFALKGEQWHVVLDAKALPCEWFAWGSLAFSPDGKNAAWKVREGSRWRAVIDGEPGPLFDRMPESGPAWLADGTLEYLAVQDGMLMRVRHAK